MSAAVLPIQTWMDLMKAAIEDVTRGFGGVEGTAAPAPDRVQPWGGYISLIGENDSIRLGVSASEAGCMALARGVLVLEDDVELPKPVVADAVCELLNIIAGNLKRRAQDLTGKLSITLPLFLTEAPRTGPQLELAVEGAAIGPTPVAFVVMRTLGEASRPA
jgi:hypothetical protein